jgi:hypothetical protein
VGPDVRTRAGVKILLPSQDLALRAPGQAHYRCVFLICSGVLSSNLMARSASECVRKGACGALSLVAEEGSDRSRFIHAA